MCFFFRLYLFFLNDTKNHKKRTCLPPSLTGWRRFVSAAVHRCDASTFIDSWRYWSYLGFTRFCWILPGFTWLCHLIQVTWVWSSWTRLCLGFLGKFWSRFFFLMPSRTNLPNGAFLKSIPLASAFLFYFLATQRCESEKEKEIHQTGLLMGFRGFIRIRLVISSVIWRLFGEHTGVWQFLDCRFFFAHCSIENRFEVDRQPATTCSTRLGGRLMADLHWLDRVALIPQRGKHKQLWKPSRSSITIDEASIKATVTTSRETIIAIFPRQNTARQYLFLFLRKR